MVEDLAARDFTGASLCDLPPKERPGALVREAWKAIAAELSNDKCRSRIDGVLKVDQLLGGALGRLLRQDLGLEEGRTTETVEVTQEAQEFLAEARVVFKQRRVSEKLSTGMDGRSRLARQRAGRAVRVKVDDPILEAAYGRLEDDGGNGDEISADDLP